MFKLRLYINGQSPRSVAALNNFTSFCSRFDRNLISFEVVDVVENVERAERDKVIATPMLLKLQPAPVVRIIGDLSDSELIAKLFTPENGRVN